MSSVVIRCEFVQPVIWKPLSSCSHQDDLAVFRFQLSVNSLSSIRLQALLQPDELARAHRYYRQEDRNRFIYARAILRILAGNYTNQYPNDIRFTVGINQKPELAGNTGWQFNLSHTGDWILLAISRESVGVDVEKITPDFPFRDILTQSFSEPEQRQIEANPNPRWLFYQYWTRKEALIKATAKGMDDDLHQISVTYGEHYISESLLGIPGDWLIRSFTVADDYPAAVAYRPILEFPKFYTLDSGVFGN